MIKNKVLVIDDDKHISELISLYLKKEGYEVFEAYDGSEGVSKFYETNPDIVILDIMMPVMDGYDVCKEIRKTSTVPIIMLTAKGETFDKVLGLEIGADDYMIKPFEPKELIARVKAALRRSNISSNIEKKEETKTGEVLNFDNIEINSLNYTVKYFGKFIDFPPKEFELLFFLAKHKNQVFTRDALLDKIWGYDYIGDTRTVDVHIKRIREKLAEQTSWNIKTVWGVGYKFEVV